MSAAVRPEDYARFRELQALVARLEVDLLELEEAKRLLESGRPRAAYRVIGGRLLVEVSPEEARAFVEEELAKTKAKLEALRRELEELRAKLAGAGLAL